MDKLINLTIGQFLEDLAEKYTKRLAVKFPETDYERTFSELNNDVDKLAKGLLGMGLRNGDHAAIWSVNRPEWITLFFATAKIGVVLVPVNAYFKSYEFQYVLKQSDCRALFISNGYKGNDYMQAINDLCPELKSCAPGSLFLDEFPLLRTDRKSVV